jgi:hypothetical protein
MICRDDISIIEYYKVEYYREWYSAWKSGKPLNANDVRVRLSIK